MTYWDRFDCKARAFDQIIGSGPRLKRTPFVFGGAMILHRELFECVPFDPLVTRGEDVDYLINSRMFGFSFFLDNTLSIKHLPQPKSHPQWKRLREDIYRFIYQRAKMQSQHKTGNLVHVSPEDFDPYPGEFLKPDLDEKIYRSSMMLSSQYLANNDPDAAMEAMRNIYIAKHNAPPALDAFRAYLDTQTQWERLIRLVRQERYAVRAGLDTPAALDAVGVAYAGEDETYIYEKDGGVKVGIYCLYNQLTYNAMSILSAQAQEKLVAASRDKIAAGLKSLEEAGADFTIACLHMGREGYYEPTDVQTELCRYTVDAGFNAVYCTHAHRLQPAEDYNGGVIFYGLGNFIFGGHTNPGNGTDPGAYDTGIAQLTLKRVGGEVTLDSYSFIPCSLSSTVGPDSTVLGPNTLNNYQPQPYTEGGDAWNRAMSMLNGTYEGANYQVDYGNVLTAMNG